MHEVEIGRDRLSTEHAVPDGGPVRAEDVVSAELVQEMRKITLHAEDLWSRGGFSDGDILEEFWPEVLFEDSSDADPHGEEHRVLIYLVRNLLLPKVDPQHYDEIMEIVTNHNPIRVSNHFHAEVPDEVREISVTVTEDEVLLARDEVRLDVIKNGHY